MYACICVTPYFSVALARYSRRAIALWTKDLFISTGTRFEEKSNFTLQWEVYVQHYWRTLCLREYVYISYCVYQRGITCINSVGIAMRISRNFIFKKNLNQRSCIAVEYNDLETSFENYPCTTVLSEMLFKKYSHTHTHT